jgi:adenylate cyclase class 2
MRMEVEQKFRVDDLAAVEARLAELGVAVSPPRTEADLYFAHPARDFARTDEALRVRRAGAATFLTYKGPKIDATTKTRREIDLPLAVSDEGPEALRALLEALGFTPVAEVRKRRRKAMAPWEGRQIEVSLDEVDRVGTFVELELIADEVGVEPAKTALASLAARLGLSANERRSYLQLLLGASSGPGALR